jgi:hypothetical protein
VIRWGNYYSDVLCLPACMYLYRNKSKFQGWVIFGGGPKDFATSQKLASVDGAWEVGPELYTGDISDHGLCAVQVLKRR